MRDTVHLITVCTLLESGTNSPNLLLFINSFRCHQRIKKKKKKKDRKDTLLQSLLWVPSTRPTRLVIAEVLWNIFTIRTAEVMGLWNLRLVSYKEKPLLFCKRAGSVRGPWRLGLRCWHKKLYIVTAQGMTLMHPSVFPSWIQDLLNSKTCGGWGGNEV